MTTQAPADSAIVDKAGLLSQPWRQFMRSVAGDAYQVGDYLLTARQLDGGWRLCDGTVVQQVDYASLYALIGAQLPTGGAGSFHLPTIAAVFASGGTGSPGELPIAQTWIKAK